ncbi:sister chromatid cohesion protein 1, partial [Coemansia helicoidea]
ALTEFDILLPSPVHLHAGGAPGLGAGAASNTSRLQDITLAEQHFDISAVARGAELGGEAVLGEEDLLGRDDDFRLDLDDDFVLSPPHVAHMDLDGSALEPEVGRDAVRGLEESMVGLRAGDVSLAKAAGVLGNDASAMDITHEELGLHGDGDVLRFGDASGMGSPGRLADVPMAPTTQEAALQEAEAEVLAAGGAAPRLAKRRRLNLADLVSSEATSLSPNEIRARLNDPADIVRMPTYLPAARAARLEVISPAAVAAQFLAATPGAPFASLFGPAAADIEQRVPSGTAGDESFVLGGEPLVPEHALDEGGFRFDDAGDELAFGAELEDAEALLGDKSIEQLERLEEESLQRRAEEEQQQLGGVRLFAGDAAGRDEGAAAGAPLEAGGSGDAVAAGEGEGRSAAVGGHSTSTVQAIHILDAAARAKGVPASAALAADAAPDRGEALSFVDVAKDARRDDAVKLFFELLVLKTRDFVDVAQAAPYEDISIVPRPKLAQAAAGGP